MSSKKLSQNGEKAKKIVDFKRVHTDSLSNYV